MKLNKQYKYINPEMLERIFLIQNPSNMQRCNSAAIDTLVSLAPKGCKVQRDGDGNVMISRGNGKRPYYLAHLDQVHDYAPYMRLHCSKQGVLHASGGDNEQVGVGGDDKCGIYAAMTMLHLLPNVSVVFVRDEEVGCQGSSTVPLKWFRNAQFVIQCDRNNHSMDVISNTNGMTCASEEFVSAVLELPACGSAGHTENTGSITDVGELASRDLHISMINLSSGYHHAHTAREIVILEELSIACAVCYEAGTLLNHKVWKHKPSSSWGRSYGGYTGSYGSYGSYWGDEYDNLTAPKAGGESKLQAALRTMEEDGGEKLILEDEIDDGFTQRDSYTREEVIEYLEDHGYDRTWDALDRFDNRDLEACALDCGYSIRIVG